MSTKSAKTGDGRVRTRTVFYISGYDPRGPSHYHGLYRDEAARQSKLNGRKFEVHQRHAAGAHEAHWTVTSGGVQTDYRFLRYDDIMRKRWSKTLPGISRDILHSFFPLLFRGITAKTLRLSWPTLVTMVSPFMLFASGLLAAIVAGLAAFYFSNWIGGLAACFAVLMLIAALRPSIERRFGSLWLARILSFIAAQGQGSTPDMEVRIDHFARRIAETLESAKADEVLLVGHSIGAQIAASSAARALRLIGSLPLKLSLLTLGQSIPLLSMQRGGGFLRKEVQELASDPRLDWIDVTAAIDSACFPMTDPLAASRLTQPDPENPKPKLLAARFHKMFKPATYKAIRRDFKRTHFQYIMASEIEGDYDYFLITAGDRTLASRYQGHKSVANFNRFKLGRS